MITTTLMIDDPGTFAVLACYIYLKLEPLDEAVLRLVFFFVSMCSRSRFLKNFRQQGT